MYIKFIGSILWIFCGVLTPAALGQQSDKVQLGESENTLMTLGEIDGETTANLSLVTIRLDHTPSWKTLGPIQNHGSFLQIVLPGTIVPEPGKFYDGGNIYLPKIGAFQISPSDAAIRLFTSPSTDASTLLKAVKAETLGSRIVVTIDPALLPKGVKGTESSDAIGPPHVAQDLTADDVIAKTTVRTDIPSPAETMKSPSALSPSPLRSHLTQLATGGAFLAALILIAIGLKPYLRKRQSLLQKSDQSLAIKTLASLPLAARQKVSVIQVGNERILLGLTPDAITFLTVLESTGAGAVTARDAGVPMAQLPSSQTRKLESLQTKERDRSIPRETKDFSDLMHGEGPTVGLKEAPRLKKMTGNDEVTLGENQLRSKGLDLPTKTRNDSAASLPQRGGRINISVGDEGIKKVTRTQPSPTKKTQPPAQEAIDDVTRLIREKLKNLKSI